MKNIRYEVNYHKTTPDGGDKDKKRGLIPTQRAEYNCTAYIFLHMHPDSRYGPAEPTGGYLSPPSLYCSGKKQDCLNLTRSLHHPEHRRFIAVLHFIEPPVTSQVLIENGDIGCLLRVLR